MLCSDNKNVPAVSYELPDGRTIEFGSQRFVLAERMFAPGEPLSNVGHKSGQKRKSGAVADDAADDKNSNDDGNKGVSALSIPTLATRSVNCADVDVQRDMLASESI